MQVLPPGIALPSGSLRVLIHPTPFQVVRKSIQLWMGFALMLLIREAMRNKELILVPA